MEYEVEYDFVTPGTAGIAQRISSGYEDSRKKGIKETSKLFALMRNEVMPCGQNQF